MVKGNNLYNYLVSFTAAIGGLLFGYEIGVISQVLSMDAFRLKFGSAFINSTLPTLETNPLTYLGVVSDTDFKADFNGNITFTFLAGCMLGSVIVSFLADGIGRKWSILCSTVLFCIGGVLQAVCETPAVLYTGRVVSGLGIGISSMVVPMFISETSEQHLRGRMVTIQQLMITIGIFVASCINSVIIKSLDKRDDNTWKIAMGMQVVPGAVLLFLVFLLPYSPRWLMARGRESEAISTIARLRSDDISSNIVQTEFREIKEGIEEEAKVGTASFSELLKPGILNRVVIGIVLQFWQQWTGINVILYYQNDLFKSMGFNPDDAAIPFTLANNFINFIATFPGMYLIERMGRRKLLLFGGLGMGTAHLLVCLFYGLSTRPGQASLAWGAIFSIYIFIISFASTWGPVAWVYCSEIYPLRIRAKGIGMSTFSNWMWNAIIAKITPLIQTEITFYTYLIFAFTGFAMSTFVYFFVPETMGKSLEQMEQLFGMPPLTHGNSSMTLAEEPEKKKEKV